MTPIILAGSTLYAGDCREVMRTLAADSVDAIVTDPPYGLAFMGKAWDHAVPGVEYWAEALRVAKPGAHLLAFGGTRTFHRMVCAIEDAGWEIRDRIQWLYGSGFPKSLDVSKALDKAAGAERRVVGLKTYADGETYQGSAASGRSGGGIMGEAAVRGPSLETAPATDAARQWEGWGTALKPAHEPIIMARKPLVGTVAANVLAHGTGGLNIDGCRVGTSAADAREMEGRSGGHAAYGPDDTNVALGKGLGRPVGEFWSPSATGRWPANVIHDGSDEVLAGFPETVSGGGVKNPVGGALTWKKSSNWQDSGNYGANSGSAARFFYCAKASREDRNDGCAGLPLKPSGMVSNTSGQHMTRRDGGAPAPAANNHPTVKPTDLMRYLCRLVTPPGGTVLDPFMGSGSTGRGAVAEGFSFVGIEQNADYVAIARVRIVTAQANAAIERAAAVDAQRQQRMFA